MSNKLWMKSNGKWDNLSCSNTNIGSNNIPELTEERIIATFKGKPVYEKYIQYSISKPGKECFIPVNDKIEDIIDLIGFGMYDNVNGYYFPLPYSNHVEFAYQIGAAVLNNDYKDNPNTVRIMFGSSYSSKDWEFNIRIQYTKTND